MSPADDPGGLAGEDGRHGVADRAPDDLGSEEVRSARLDDGGNGARALCGERLVPHARADHALVVARVERGGLGERPVDAIAVEVAHGDEDSAERPRR